MSIDKKIKIRKKRRAFRVRNAVKSQDGLRVSIFRSLNHVYGQIIDDAQQRTVISYSTLENSVKGNKKEQAKAVGLELAKRAINQGIKKVVFDRGPYLYHGRVKEFAEGLREGGLAV